MNEQIDFFLPFEGVLSDDDKQKLPVACLCHVAGRLNRKLRWS